MRIVVCAKQVPDTEAKVTVGKDGRSIDETGITFIINPYDEFALEEGLRIKERLGGEATVTMVCVGPPRAEEALRTGLAMGADQAVHIWDESLARADAAAVAAVLHAAVAQIGFDLILCGRVAIDDASAQVGLRLAERLGLPHANAVTKLEIQGQKLLAYREVEGGVEVVEMPLPAVVTAQKGLNEPRYPTIPAIMKARRKEIGRPTLVQLGLGAQEVADACRSEVLSLQPAPGRKGGRLVAGEPEEAARTLAHLLREEAKVL
ncbi:MAG: electron transfer flavoprotein subunit beta/FixA family protein [Bacillota bacterium]